MSSARRWLRHLTRPLPACHALPGQVDFDVELVWREQGYDGVRMLQARAPVQPPVVQHPVSGEPTWFCNVHSHSSLLRKQREGLYGAERFESGASQINKSDMYYGAPPRAPRACRVARCVPERSLTARLPLARASFPQATAPS